jgi:hypothetical protein
MTLASEMASLYKKVSHTEHGRDWWVATAIRDAIDRFAASKAKRDGGRK